jgi:hypothetical protein
MVISVGGLLFFFRLYFFSGDYSLNWLFFLFFASDFYWKKNSEKGSGCCCKLRLANTPPVAG